MTSPIDDDEIISVTIDPSLSDGTQSRLTSISSNNNATGCAPFTSRKDASSTTPTIPNDNNRFEWGKWFAIFLICLINCINYINRYLLPPTIDKLKVAFSLNDMQLGLIQTCFEIVYVVSSPIFGYLGDRFNRRNLIAISLVVANASNFASSFVPEGNFYLLVVTRAVLGLGEAAFSNIGPVIIGDMFVGKMRTVVFSLFQFAIPVGMCLGYISASVVVDHLGDWRWPFRLTAGPMAICLVLMLIFVREPRRGEAENASPVEGEASFIKDTNYILKLPSFTLMTGGFIGVAFTTEALCYWVPSLISRMFDVNGTIDGTEHSQTELGLIFGVISVVSGIVGVALGPAISAFMKARVGQAADGIVCGANMLLAAPFVYILVMAAQGNMPLVIWVSAFIAIVLMCSCFVLVTDITMNVVVPTRRTTASAFMSAVSHLLGDALSPYIIGTVSDQLRTAATEFDKPGSINLFADFISIQRSLFLPTFIIALSGGLFLLSSLFINEDTKNATALSHQQQRDQQPSNDDKEANQIVSNDLSINSSCTNVVTLVNDDKEEPPPNSC